MICVPGVGEAYLLSSEAIGQETKKPEEGEPMAEQIGYRVVGTALHHLELTKPWLESTRKG